jgi:hypothetical protein
MWFTDATAPAIGRIGTAPPSAPEPQPSPPAPPAPAKPVPSNLFRFGTLRRDVRHGTASLSVIVPGPGTLVLAGKRRAIRATGTAKLRIAATGAVRRRLLRTGRVNVRAKVTYTPVGGTPRTRAKTITLVARR